jgi:DNA-binding IclR family transcriptional regulator
LYFYGDPANGRASDPAAVDADLGEVRRLGYGSDLGAVQPGLHAVSAPLLGGRDQARPVGIVTLYGTFPAETVSQHGERVRASAAEMSLHLAPFLEGRS